MNDHIHPDDDSSNPSEPSADSMRYLTIMIEQVLDQNRTVLEAVTDMQVHVAKIPAIQEDISELKQDMKTVKSAVKDTNHDLRKLEMCVDRLETAVYSPA